MPDFYGDFSDHSLDIMPNFYGDFSDHSLDIIPVLFQRHRSNNITVYSKRNAHSIPNFFVAPLGEGGQKWINVRFFWNRLYHIVSLHYYLLFLFIDNLHLVLLVYMYTLDTVSHMAGLPRSMPIKAMALIRSVSQCRSLLINADKFRSIPLNADQCRSMPINAESRHQ